MAPFKKQLRILHSIRINLRRRESFNARPQAAMDVVLQARARMIARQVDLATRNKETAMNELSHAVSKIPGKVRTVVCRAVLPQPSRDKHLGVAVGQRELYIGVSLIVPQQDVKSRLALLDQVVLKRQGLVLIGYQDVFKVHRLAHQRPCFGVGLRRSQQVRPYPRAQVLGLAHINNLSLGVLVEVHARVSGQSADFFV